MIVNFPARTRSWPTPVYSLSMWVSTSRLLRPYGLRFLADGVSPVRLVADRFQLPHLTDAVGGACDIEARVTRWSEATYDIAALRRMAADGPLSIDPTSRPLLATSLSVSKVKSDDQGSTRLVKMGTNNTARDDVAAAFVLVAGAYERAMKVVTEPQYLLAG